MRLYIESFRKGQVSDCFTILYFVSKSLVFVENCFLDVLDGKRFLLVKRCLIKTLNARAFPCVATRKVTLNLRSY